MYCGLFSFANGAKISNVITSGYISPTNDHEWTGGIVGYSVYTEIYNCINMADIKVGYVCVGGIAGHFQSGKIVNCINFGNINTYFKDINDNAVGGIVGHFYFGTIMNCFNAGSISSNENVGGIVGMLERNDFELKNCINNGIIEARNNTTNRKDAIVGNRIY